MAHAPTTAAELTAEEVIDLLQLAPLPHEGGFFRQVWQSAARVPPDSVPWKVKFGRPFGTAILFLVTREAFSALHRLPGDEMYHLLQGDPLEQLLLRPDGGHEVRVLGTDLRAGRLPAGVVPGGCWQGSRPAGPRGWSLVSATMAPGWAEADFELGHRAELRKAYPACATHINQFTRA